MGLGFGSDAWAKKQCHANTLDGIQSVTQKLLYFLHFTKYVSTL